MTEEAYYHMVGDQSISNCSLLYLPIIRREGKVLESRKSPIYPSPYI